MQILRNISFFIELYGSWQTWMLSSKTHVVICSVIIISWFLTFIIVSKIAPNFFEINIFTSHLPLVLGVFDFRCSSNSGGFMSALLFVHANFWGTTRRHAYFSTLYHKTGTGFTWSWDLFATCQLPLMSKRQEAFNSYCSESLLEAALLHDTPRFHFR